ncbi:MAG: hypothetical protein GY699_07460 [Desulfobacteraceae bacterium]|nr:hypothetical protein [Desulfobacteraceae bacterium]
MENTPRGILSLKDFYAVIFRYKLFISIIFIVTVVSVGNGIHFLTEIYEAKASLLVKMGRENMSLPSVNASVQNQVISMGLRKEDINSEIRILKNRYILKKVEEKLGIDYLFPASKEPTTLFKRIKFQLKQIVKQLKGYLHEVLYRLDFKKRLTLNQKALIALEKRVIVNQVQGSDVIEITVRWPSPDIAARILDTLLEFFYDHHMMAHKNSGGYKLIQDQVTLAEADLLELEDELEQLKSNQGISQYEQQETQLLEQVTSFKATYRITITDISEARVKKQELARQLSSIYKTVQLSEQTLRNPILDTLKSTLINLEVEMRQLEVKYLKNSRPVLEIQQKIDELKKQLAQESDTVRDKVVSGINTTYKDIEKKLLSQESVLKSLEEKKQTLNEHIGAYTEELNSLGENHLKLKQLQRQIGLAEDTYNFYRKRLEEARVAEVQDNQKILNTRIISPTSASYSPVRPRKLLLLGLSMVISLIVGIGVAIVSNYLDQSIRSVEDVQRYLNLPTIHSIREFK